MDETRSLKQALAEYIKWFGKRETKQRHNFSDIITRRTE